MTEQLRNFFSNALGNIVAFLPNLLSAVVVLVVGYLVSRLLGTVARRLLARANFDGYVANKLQARGDAAQKRSSPLTARRPSATLGSFVFWVGMLITLSLTAQALRLATLAAGLNTIIGYVPRVMVAAIIVGVAIALANTIADFVGEVSSYWLARSLKFAIIALSVFMALDQLGVARNIVTAGFIAVVGAAAVAAAVAFGVGNIDMARDYSRRMQMRRRESESRRGGQYREYPSYGEGTTMTTGGSPPPETPGPETRTH